MTGCKNISAAKKIDANKIFADFYDAAERIFEKSCDKYLIFRGISKGNSAGKIGGAFHYNFTLSA